MRTISIITTTHIKVYPTLIH